MESGLRGSGARSGDEKRDQGDEKGVKSGQ